MEFDMTGARCLLLCMKVHMISERIFAEKKKRKESSWRIS